MTWKAGHLYFAGLAAAIAFIATLAGCTCPSKRPENAGGVPSGPASKSPSQGGDPVSGHAVTKDVPHSSESLEEIREREAKDPLPPRGDKAIHSHKIRGGDNSSTNPDQGNAPAGTQKRPGTAPEPIGGY